MGVGPQSSTAKAGFPCALCQSVYLYFFFFNLTSAFVWVCVCVCKSNYCVSFIEI